MKTAVFFLQADTDGKCSCPEEFYYVDQTYDGHNGANFFWVEVRAQNHWLIDVFDSILTKNIAYLAKLP